MLLDKIRKYLRITGTSLDEDVEDTIAACFADMSRVGVKIYESDGSFIKNIEEDPLILACQKFYARWQFNFENAAERYEKAYCSCRDGLSLSGDYNA